MHINDLCAMPRKHVAVVVADDYDTVGFVGDEIDDLREMLETRSANHYEVFIWTPNGIEHVSIDWD